MCCLLIKMADKVGVLFLAVLVCEVHLQAIDFLQPYPAFNLPSNFNQQQLANLYPSVSPLRPNIQQSIAQQASSVNVEASIVDVDVDITNVNSANTLVSQPTFPYYESPPIINLPFPQQAPIFSPISVPSPILNIPPPIKSCASPPISIQPIPSIPPFVSPRPQLIPEINSLPNFIPIPTLPKPILPSPVIQAPSVPSIPLISTTVVDNSLANSLANVIQLLIVSRLVESQSKPYPYPNLAPLYNPVGTIGTTNVYTPLIDYDVIDTYAEVVAPVNLRYTDVVSNPIVSTIAEVVSPVAYIPDNYYYNDIYGSPLMAEVILPNSIPAVLTCDLSQIYDAIPYSYYDPYAIYY